MNHTSRNHKRSVIKSILDRELKDKANSFTLFLYQGKEPNGLEKFKKNK